MPKPTTGSSESIVCVRQGDAEPVFARVANNFRRIGALPTLLKADIRDGAVVLIGEWPDGGEFVMRSVGHWHVRLGLVIPAVLRRQGL